MSTARLVWRDTEVLVKNQSPYVIEKAFRKYSTSPYDATLNYRHQPKANIQTQTKTAPEGVATTYRITGKLVYFLLLSMTGVTQCIV